MPLDDFSDVIEALSSGTYTVKRSAAPTRVGGRAYASIVESQLWAPSTAYVVGDRRKNGANVYTVITAGVSAASGGPTGTGSDITDGTVHWKFSGPAATTFEITASVQPMSGRELDRLPEGLRQREVRVVFTATELKGTADTQEADEITIDGEQWQVQTPESWLTLGNYFRAVVARVGR